MIIYQFPLNKIIFLHNIQKFIVRCNSMFIYLRPILHITEFYRFNKLTGVSTLLLNDQTLIINLHITVIK